MEYGKKLKEIRTYDLHTQEEVANKLGIKKSSYCLYETQKKIIPLTRLNLFCNLFNVSIDYVLGLSKENINNNKKADINIESISKRLKKFRKDNKITQVKLGNELKIDRSMISKYEDCKTLVSTIFVFNFCKKYKISADYLLGKTDSPIFITEK